MNQKETKTERLLILDRVRWARGTSTAGPANKLLSAINGSMCCLGYCMAQEGVPREVLLSQGEPADALGACCEYSGPVPGYLVNADDEHWLFSDTDLTGEAMSINDNSASTDEEKVTELNELFNLVGIRVVLVNTPEEVDAMGGIPVDFGNFRFGDAK